MIFLQIWADVSELSFKESEVIGAEIIIDFFTGDHGDGNPFDGPGGILAHAFSPSTSLAPSIAGDAHFDEDETFTQFTTAGRFVRTFKFKCGFKYLNPENC